MKLHKWMLCPQCNSTKQVTGIDDHIVTLDCGHRRGESIPVKAGRVSIEHLRTKLGQQMFPANRDGDRTASPEWQDWVEHKWR